MTTSKFKTARSHGQVAIVAPELLRMMLKLFFQKVHEPLAAGKPHERCLYIEAPGTAVSKSGREVAKIVHEYVGARVHITRIRQIY